MALFKAGDTFLIGSAHGSSTKLHLYVVVCDPSGNPLTILAVPFNTVTTYTDSTLILDVGSHPFVNRPTAVSFDLMTELGVDKLSQLEELCSAGKGTMFSRQSPTSKELLERIINGALTSDLTPKGMVKALKARLGL